MLSYIGGKSKIGKWIVPFYDKNMEVYLETFGGMFWCFYNMDLKKFPIRFTQDCGVDRFWVFSLPKNSDSRKQSD